MKDRSKVLFGFVMLLMVVGIIGFSYALFTTKVEKKGALNIVAGTVSCPIESKDLTNNQITLKADAEREIEITLTNQSLTNIHSTITYSGNNVEVSAASSNESAIEVESLAIGNTKTYILRLKNNGTSDETITFYGRCGLSNKTLAVAENESKITETYERIEPNAPKLVEGLIPVVYDEEKASWVKANTTKQWYNYYNQEWANAVTVVEKTTNQETGHNRDYYQKAEAGTPINMDDINTMWVWIPRYEYKFTSMSQDQEIGINFISSTAKESTQSLEYKVHPAFTFDNKELDGFWYAKFETSSEEQKFSEGEANSSSLTPIIKPGVTSWRYINISNAFYVALNMTSDGKIAKYGFKSGEVDTHMSKSNEWGAVAYLSHSRYGKYGNDDYEFNDKEVYINNCSSYITGIAGNTASDGQSAETCKTNTYETIQGQKASTTGNITGIYDMSGGAWERVMGVLDNGSGKLTTALSGFVEGESGNKIPDSKYYDLYGSSIETACSDGVCYGHALSETSGWYGDYHNYLTVAHPWSRRGSDYDDGTYAGMFTFAITRGGPDVWDSFRLVLAPIGA